MRFHRITVSRLGFEIRDADRITWFRILILRRPAIQNDFVILQRRDRLARQIK